MTQAVAIPPMAQATPTRKYRIIVGIHLGDGPVGCICEDCLRSGGKNHIYRARKYDKNGISVDPPEYTGDVIESATDLVKKLNQGNSRKFDYVGAAPVPVPLSGPITAEEAARRGFVPGVLPAAPPVPVADPVLSLNLESMTLKELQEVAEDNEIDIRGAKTKDEVLRLLRASR